MFAVGVGEPRLCYDFGCQRGVGTWRSLVAHSAGGRVVAGSNPAVPTL